MEAENNMVSKNNRVKRMEEAAERQSHFSIRKLTIGAASVLLGTTLWMGTHVDVAKAADNNANDNGAHAEQASNNQMPKIDSNTQVVAEVTSSNKNAGIESQTDAQLQKQNDSAIESKVEAPVTQKVEKSAATETIPSASAKNKSAEKSEEKTTTPSANADTQQATVERQTNNASENLNKADSSVALTNKKVDLNNLDLSKAGIKGQLATDKTLSAAQALDLVKANAAGVVKDNQKISDEDAKKLKALYGVSLVQEDDASSRNVSDWNDFQSALNNSSVKNINLTENISGYGNLDINHDVTINGNNNAINLGTGVINNNAKLTLKDVNINGSIVGHGEVDVEGKVTSNVDNGSASKFVGSSVADVRNQLTAEVGTADHGIASISYDSSIRGYSANNWTHANIVASRVNVAQGATLNINRSITGDGIAEPDHGVVNVGINAKLNINLKDAQTASRSNEKSSSLDNASAGVRILDNGTFTSGDSAEITINAGHGRAVVIDEPFGGTDAVAANTIMPGWENGRTGDKSAEAAKHRNTMTLGDSTKMNLTGRGGIVLGYTATFTTGDHSIIHIDNKGNGEGLLLDANSVVEVSPHSQLLMTSDGKNASGDFSGGNYIGMGQNAKFRVEHDATFRYRLTNSANNEKRPYADNFNIISQASNTHPEVYVGPNATFDGQSDYDDYYGEIFAFSLTSGRNTSTVFQIDGAKYVNWEKNSQVLGHDGAGNLFY